MDQLAENLYTGNLRQDQKPSEKGENTTLLVSQSNELIISAYMRITIVAR